jgi:hypothetical protein
MSCCPLWAPALACPYVIVPGVAVDFVVTLRGLGHAGALPWVHGALGAWCSGVCRGSMQCAGIRRVDGHVV